MMSMAVAPAWGGGWITFTWILWWINVVLAVTVGVGVPYQMFAAQVHAPADMTAAWLLPTVATIVAAASGSIVAEILPPSHARFAPFRHVIATSSSY
jgi:tellurite resistance protein TehA-like permease